MKRRRSTSQPGLRIREATLGHLLSVGCWVLVGGMLSAADRPVDFNRDVRPILSDKCVLCHGPDANHREADLRLDLEEGAAAVLKPGSSGESELFLRVSSDDEFLKMPPPDSNRTLSADEIETLRRWIDEGANWNEHWSFQPLEAPPIPEQPPIAPGRIQNPIDTFVQAKLAEHGWQPAPEADRRTLIRRVSLDLTGLPPTPDEVAAFVDDPDPDAYAKLVDRLLDSPAYGERMAWDWLDAARYADTNGYQGDSERTMWPWRDWVIQAFNRNLPYDQFTVEQLAGDLLPDATFEQKLATAFNRNHMINGEGGRIPEENRVDYVMDMTETMGTVWLGLTLNCCRCHDHKFDPITQEEYYQLSAYFNQTPVDGAGGNPQTPPVLPVPDSAQRQRSTELKQQLAAVERQISEREAELAKQQQTWEESRRTAASWDVCEPLRYAAKQQHLRLLDDGSLLAEGPTADNDTYEVIVPVTRERLRALRLDVLRHESLNGNSLSRADSGNFVLTDFEVRAGADGIPQSEWRRLPIAKAEATFEQGNHAAQAAIDDDPQSGWAVYEGRKVDREHSILFHFAEPLDATPGSQLSITLRHDSPHVRHNIGRFRLSATDQPDARLNSENPELAGALQTPADQRNDEQRQRIAQAHRSSDDAWSKLNQQRTSLQNKLDALDKSIPKVMVMEDQPEPRTTFLLNRGLYNNPADPVSAGTPASLPPLPDNAPPNRLALAEWIVSDENPLTARVTVNRFWQQVFGIGLVKTPEDFGRQGEVPPQLELLNWLAADFRDHDWNVKRLMRMIVLSHTYRQDSGRSHAGAPPSDPENRWLARGPRFRMPFWMLRDQALAASGLLVGKIGGAPVNGYQPPGVWEEATFGKKKYVQDHGEALYRRSLYTFWRRIIAPTMFFDNASRQTCTVKPLRTNTPLHALYTLNDVTFVEAARVLAERVLADETAGGDAARLDAMFQRILARSPSPGEAELLLAGLGRTRRQFEQSPDDAAKLLSMGESPRADLDAVEHASWTALGLALFNLDETLTKE